MSAIYQGDNDASTFSAPGVPFNPNGPIAPAVADPQRVPVDMQDLPIPVQGQARPNPVSDSPAMPAYQWTVADNALKP